MIVSPAKMNAVSQLVRCAVILLSLALALPASTGGVTAASCPESPTGSAIVKALEYLRQQQGPDGGIGGFADSAFACVAIAAAGEDPGAWNNGGLSLVDYLKAGPPDVTEELNMCTFLARMVLAAVACDERPDAFGTWSGAHLGVTVRDGDYLGALKSLHDGTQFLQDLTGEPDSAETLNDDFWAVRALITAGEPTASPEVSAAVQFITDHQEPDGGWTWGTSLHSWHAPDSSDVDSTAAALVALCLGGCDGAGVSGGLAFMKANQDVSGGFASPWAGVNAQSTAWALDAIAASGDEPAGDAWAPVEKSPLDYLLSTQLSDGSFDGGIRATADAVIALTGASGGVSQPMDRTEEEAGDAANVPGIIPGLLIGAGVFVLALVFLRLAAARRRSGSWRSSD